MGPSPFLLLHTLNASKNERRNSRQTQHPQSKLGQYRLSSISWTIYSNPSLFDCLRFSTKSCLIIVNSTGGVLKWGTPKLSILGGFSIINHHWGIPISGKTTGLGNPKFAGPATAPWSGDPRYTVQSVLLIFALTFVLIVALTIYAVKTKVGSRAPFPVDRVFEKGVLKVIAGFLGIMYHYVSRIFPNATHGACI